MSTQPGAGETYQVEPRALFDLQRHAAIGRDQQHHDARRGRDCRGHQQRADQVGRPHGQRLDDQSRHGRLAGGQSAAKPWPRATGTAAGERNGSRSENRAGRRSGPCDSRRRRSAGMLRRGNQIPGVTSNKRMQPATINAWPQGAGWTAASAA